MFCFGSIDEDSKGEIPNSVISSHSELVSNTKFCERIYHENFDVPFEYEFKSTNMKGTSQLRDRGVIIITQT